MLQLLPDPAGKTCLDAACGSGRYCLLLLDRGVRRVLGVDLSLEMLARAREATPAPLLAASFTRLPLADGLFDIIICGLAVGHAPDLALPLAEMARTLRPGGTLVYSDFHPDATRAGMQRTFRDRAGQTWALEHHPHEVATHLACARKVGLEVTACLEPTLPEVAGDCPLVLVLRAAKPT